MMYFFCKVIIMKLLPRQIEQIYKCSDYCNLAYTSLKDQKGVVFIENKDTDTQAFVISSGKDIIICGQGTTSFKDWTIDFQISRTNLDFLPHGRVHKGFAKAYSSVREQIKEEVGKLMLSATYERIICTGHSLFGAIATIAAVDFAILYDNVPVHCVSFGSPRVGNSRFVKMFDKVVEKSFRCVCKNDPVSRVPLCIRFEHVPGKITYGHLTFKDMFLCCGVKNHSMNEYCEAAKPLNMRLHEFLKSKNLPVNSRSSDEMTEILLENIQ